MGGKLITHTKNRQVMLHGCLENRMIKELERPAKNSKKQQTIDGKQITQQTHNQTENNI